MHRVSRQVFALKVIDKERAERMRKRHPNIRKEIMMERNALFRMSHPHVVQLFNTWAVRFPACIQRSTRPACTSPCCLPQDARSMYYLMEFAPGGELWGHLTEGTGDAAPLVGMSEPLAAFYLQQVAWGLEAVAKAGFIHRDLKPENIVLGPPRASPLIAASGDFRDIPGSAGPGASAVARLIDFGTAKDTLRPEMNGPEFVGTPEYLPPEVVQGGEGGHAMDLWAFGAMLFQVLTGYHPFGTGGAYLTMQRARSAVLRLPLYLPPSACALLEATLQPDPAAREAGLVRVGADGVVAGLPGLVDAPFFSERPWREALAAASAALQARLPPPREPFLRPSLAEAAPEATTSSAPKPPPPPPSALPPLRWPEVPTPDDSWITVQSEVQALVNDAVLSAMAGKVHPGCPSHSEGAASEEAREPPDTRQQGSTATLRTTMTTLSLDEVTHWWSVRERVQALPAPQRQHVRHQLALRHALWPIPTLALFAPQRLHTPALENIDESLQACWIWGALCRVGVSPRQPFEPLLPTGAPDEHTNWSGPFSLAVIALPSPDGLEQAIETLAQQAHDPPLRAVLLCVGSVTDAAHLVASHASALSQLPAATQWLLQLPDASEDGLDGDAQRYQNVTWQVHGCRVLAWDPQSATQPAGYAWFQDALDSSKFGTQHTVVCCTSPLLQGVGDGGGSMPKRVFCAARKLVHHSSNARMLVSPVGSLQEEASPDHLGQALAAVRDSGHLEQAEASLSPPDPCPHSAVLNAGGTLTWQVIDDEEAGVDARQVTHWQELWEAAAAADEDDDLAAQAPVTVAFTTLNSSAPGGTVQVLHFTDEGVSTPMP